jgi:Family of unknown function (DUF5763)/Stress-induced bacterial acidophilic repeat motif
MTLKRSKPTPAQCKATTSSGERCKARPHKDNLCLFHFDPKKAAELGRKGGRANRHTFSAPTQEVVPPESVGDVKRMLAQTMADVRAGKMDPKLGATLAYIATALLRAYEAEPPVPPERPSIYRALQFCTVPREKDLGYEILDLNPGLPAARDTRANRTRSAIVVWQDEVLQDAAAGAAPAQSGKVEVAPHKEGDELLVLDD